MSHLTALQHLLHEHAAEGLLVTGLTDMRWANGFSGSNGVLLVLPNATHLITDRRYALQAEQETACGVIVHATATPLYGYISEQGLLAAGQTFLLQAEQVTLQFYEQLSTLFPAVNWVPQPELIAPLRAVKTDAEREAIRGAQHITEAVFLHLLDWLQPGYTEREVAGEVIYQHLKRGADKMSFDPIVASGPNAALPHARPSDRVLRSDEAMVIDMGCFCAGYASDMTRTVVLGNASDRFRNVYGVVLQAQEAALDVARAGMRSNELDAVARVVIQEAGYGAAFEHSLGHGLGLDIHEWPPVSYRSDDVLPEGAIVTIEPGVYLAGEFGVRIEDMVQLHAEGVVNLTSAPKTLIEIRK